MCYLKPVKNAYPMPENMFQMQFTTTPNARPSLPSSKWYSAAAAAAAPQLLLLPPLLMLLLPPPLPFCLSCKGAATTVCDRNRIVHHFHGFPQRVAVAVRVMRNTGQRS